MHLWYTQQYSSKVRMSLKNAKLVFMYHGSSGKPFKVCQVAFSEYLRELCDIFST